MQEPTSLRLPAILESVPLAIDFVAQLARAAGLDDRALYALQLAVDEACANVVCHAYDCQLPGEMVISCSLEGPMFVIRLRDWGASFDPNGVPMPDVTAPLEERTLGGLGLYLMRHFMDVVEFDFDPQLGNQLTMKKRLRSTGDHV
jgi:anti-sigma regulatory factor (Ser/Thr protein kinase)